MLSSIKIFEFLANLALKLISSDCSGKLIFVSRPVFLLFDIVSFILISFKTESNCILFNSLSFKFVGKFADASVIMSFCATSIAEEIPTIE